jgi:hypothetical protein
VVRPFVTSILAITLLCACQSAPVTPRPVEPTSTQSPIIATLSIAETSISAIDIARLTWVYPGAGSVLTSPIAIAAQLPSEAKFLRVELHGTDGRLLARQVLPAGASQFEVSLDFEIPRAREEARLSLSIDDALGRTVELSSIGVTLASEGSSTIEPTQSISVLEITDPLQDTDLTGGRLTISGRAGIADDPVHIEVLTSTGRVLAADDTYPSEDTGTFGLELAYRLDGSEKVLVVASQTQGGVMFFLDSVEIRLLP